MNITNGSESSLSTHKECTSQGVRVKGTAGAKGLWQKEAREHGGNCKKANMTCAEGEEQGRNVAREMTEVNQAAP